MDRDSQRATEAEEEVREAGEKDYQKRK